MGDVIQRLREVAEQYFDCQHGVPMAFFEIPQRDGEDIRVIYVTYAVRGPDVFDLEQWMIDNVILPLMEKTDGQGKLYWRLAECFDMSLDTDGLYSLRTRIGVLDKDLNVVRLDEVMKHEGQPSKVLTIG